MKTLFKKIVAILRKHGAEKISLFGSYARGEEGRQSDIDLIVKFSDQKSLLDLVGIEQEITQKTGRKIDLLTPNSISPYIARTVAKEAKVLYA